MESYVPVWVALIAALPGMVSAVLAFILQFNQRKNHAETSRRLDTIDATTNGKMDRLLQVTGESEHAKGMLAQKEQDLADGA